MTKSTETETDAPVNQRVTGIAAQTAIETDAPPTPDLDAGIKHLRATDSGAMRIWTVKGPKDVGGTISAVFLQDASRVVLLHQLASGKFAVYEKAV
jgi:hypothetical protein